MMTRHTLLTSAICALSWSAAVASAQPLDAIVREALATNPGLLAQAARIEGAAEAVPQARAQGLPDITVSGSVSAGKGSFDPGPAGEAFGDVFGGGANGGDQGALTDLAGGDTNTRRAALQVTQPVFTGFRILNGIRQARAQVSAAQANFAAATQDFAYQVAEAYLAAVAAEAALAAVDQSLNLLETSRRAAQVAFETGQNTRTDVALADARLAAIRAEKASAEANLASASAALVQIVGHEVNTPRLGNDSFDVPSDLEALLSVAWDAHPDMLAAKAEYQAQEAALAVARGQRSPSVQLRGTVSTSENQFIEGDSATNASLVAELSMPLYQGGQVGSEVRQARAELRAAELTVTQTRRDVEAALRQAYVTHQAARLRAEAAQAQRDAAALAYRGVSLEREVGQRGVIDVLEVERDLLDAEVGLIDANRALILSSWDVHRKAGLLLDQLTE